MTLTKSVRYCNLYTVSTRRPDQNVIGMAAKGPVRSEQASNPRAGRVVIDGIGPECCVFDLDGTLYSSTSGLEFDLQPAMVKVASEMLGVTPKEAHRKLHQYRLKYRASVLGLESHDGLDPNEFMDRVFQKLDLSKIVPYRGLASALGQLSSIVPLGLVTNSFRAHAERVLELLQLREYFSFVCSVDQMGFIRKPEKEAFHALLTFLPVAATHCILFDDSYLNLETAKEFGMNTVLVSNGIATPPLFWEMHRKVMHTIPSCADLSTHNLVDLLSRNLRLHATP